MPFVSETKDTRQAALRAETRETDVLDAHVVVVNNGVVEVVQP